MTKAVRGDGVVLRPFREEEAEQVWATYRDGNDGFWPHHERPSREEILERVGRSGTFQAGMLDLAIDVDGRLVGQVQARRPAGALPPGVFDLGIVIYRRDDRGKGYGTEAVRLMTEHAFRELGAHRLQLTTEVSNVAMSAAAERAGFAREGVLRGFMPAQDSALDYSIYGITREDWTGRTWT
jgi:RimJ/RimL family protein N-acetyltransferase